MKRILFFALAISMLLGVTSCGGDSSEETSEISSSAVSESQSSIAEESSEEASSELSSNEVTEKEYDTLDKTNLRKEFTTDEFLIGSWVSFYSFEKDSFETQLDNMKALGLNFNIYPKYFGGEMDMDTVASVEEEYGKRDMYYLMFGGMDLSKVNINTNSVVGLEHCIGYHIVDEPLITEFAGVAQVYKAYREADPSRYPFVNLFPSYAGEVAVGKSYLTYMEHFVKAVGAENMEYLSHDYYVFQKGGTRLGLFADMEAVRKVALENGGLRTHGFPQSTQWNGMRMPNINEMRWNAYAYLAYGFKGLSWFNLVCPGKSDTEGEGFCESIIYRDGEIHDKQLYDDFAALNKEIAVVGKTLLNLECLHAYHTKKNVDGVEYLKDWMITPDNRADLVLSHMEDRNDGTTYMMLFNKSFFNKQKAEMTINYSKIDSISCLNAVTGEWEDVAIENGKFDVELQKGEGKLYRLNMKQ